MDRFTPSLYFAENRRLNQSPAMERKSILLIVLAFFLVLESSGQDIHFSNYNYSPLYLSPAKTGAFLGSYRLGANVRDQFSNFIQKPYQTLMAYSDMTIAFGLKDHHWIGAGINVFADRAGDLTYKNTGAHLSLAYHYAIDPKYKTVISFGFQFGMTKRDINSDNYNSAETLKGNSADPDMGLIQNFNPSVGDVNIGLALKRQLTKASYIDVGIAMNHLMQSEFSFTGSSIQNPVARRLNVYAEYKIQSTSKLALRPMIVYSRMFKFQNLFGQINAEYKPNRKSDTIIKGGLGYRTGDAIQFLAGTVYKGLDIGIAFDLTISSAARFNNSNGGIEIGLKKIIKANRKPKRIPVLICPVY